MLLGHLARCGCWTDRGRQAASQILTLYSQLNHSTAAPPLPPLLLQWGEDDYGDDGGWQSPPESMISRAPPRSGPPAAAAPPAAAGQRGGKAAGGFSEEDLAAFAGDGEAGTAAGGCSVQRCISRPAAVAAVRLLSLPAYCWPASQLACAYLLYCWPATHPEMPNSTPCVLQMMGGATMRQQHPPTPTRSSRQPTTIGAAALQGLATARPLQRRSSSSMATAGMAAALRPQRRSRAAGAAAAERESSTIRQRCCAPPATAPATSVPPTRPRTRAGGCCPAWEGGTACVHSGMWVSGAAQNAGCCSCGSHCLAARTDHSLWPLALHCRQFYKCPNEACRYFK